MQSFEWVDATSIEQAATLLAAGNPSRPVVAKAGGMDLLDLMLIVTRNLLGWEMDVLNEPV